MPKVGKEACICNPKKATVQCDHQQAPVFANQELGLVSRIHLPKSQADQRRRPQATPSQQGFNSLLYMELLRNIQFVHF